MLEREGDRSGTVGGGGMLRVSSRRRRAVLLGGKAEGTSIQTWGGGVRCGSGRGRRDEAREEIELNAAAGERRERGG